MARINTNVGAVVAQRHLNQSFKSLNSTIQRLASGLRITRGADDPAGLIASERLRSEISAVNQAIANTQRASNIIATTEGALDEAARLLTDIQDLIVASANEGALSPEEIQANQLQIDSAIASITRIADATTFSGRKLLNGSLDYITSGVDTSTVQALQIHGAQFGTRDFIPVSVEVTTSAQPAQLFFNNASVASTVTIEIAGNEGVTTLQFASGTTAGDMRDAINAISDATSVSAALIDPTNSALGVVLSSQHLGSSQFVSVQALTGTFDVQDVDGNSVNRDEGRDAVALINGAASIGDGNHLTLKSAVLDMEMQLAETFGLGTTSFAITEGGALFQVGPEVNSALQVNIGVQSIAASRLGNHVVGFLSQIQSGGESSIEKGNHQQAQKIVNEAIDRVSVLRGRLGAFERNTLDTNVNSLSITMENLMSAESTIRDADFAFETSQLTRDQILVNAGTSVLALAQQTPQVVLGLLG
jgi:flagellin